jgi:hypothetical protein
MESRLNDSTKTENADVVAMAEPNPPADVEDGVVASRRLEDGVTS